MTLIDNLEARPFTFVPGRRDAAVLLCHGITGTPQSLLGWGAALLGNFCVVDCPLLPGHGTRWQDLRGVLMEDWYETVRAGALWLRNAYPELPLFIGGLSMGGTLASLLAADPDINPAGLMLVNPSFTLPAWQRWLARGLSPLAIGLSGPGNDVANGAVEVAYSRVTPGAVHQLDRLQTRARNSLPDIGCPSVVFTSPRDHVVPPTNSELFRWLATRSPSEAVSLKESFHVATLDLDAPLIFAASAAFIKRIVAA
jgi:carboxylesterase